MFDYPYYFWMVAVAFATPILATLAGLAYTRWSGNPQPLWVTLPGYFVVHLVGLFLSYCFGLDYDYLKYRRYDSFLWTAGYYGSYVLSLVGLAALLSTGLRKRYSQTPRGFDVLRQ